MTNELINQIKKSDAELLAPLQLLEVELPKKFGFKLNIQIIEGQIEIYLTSKWFMWPILLFKADIIEKIIKPLGFKVRRWFRRNTLSAPVYIIEKI